MAVEWKKLAYEDDVILKTLVSAKGDIIYASGANTPARLAIGANGHVLQVSTDVPAWAAAPAPGAHAATHEDGGADEIDVTGLSGDLADAQDPKSHAASHKSAGADSIRLDEFAVPTATVAINKQMLGGAALDRQADDPGTPALAQIYFKTGDTGVYVCTDNT